MSVQTKTYVSQGVQTSENIPSLPSTLSETLPLAASLNVAHNDDSGGVLQVDLDSSDNIRNQFRGNLTYESAYIQSKTSENSEFLPLLSSKNKKLTGMGQIGRGHPIGSQQRIVSLPNPPPPQSFANSRVVSLPESLISNSIPFHLGSSFSPDDGQSHNQPLSSRRRQWEDGHDRDYFYDVPQTPSPPSSPESVVIISNKPHVSGSFLGRTNSDDDGWVTWANSPPRPIPALHGPLSLPYARCPSGAEGTVIEGDDLSHKIWGLAVGDPHIHSTTARMGKNDMHHQSSQVASSGDESCVQPAKPFKDPNLDLQHSMSLHRPRTNVIDLSRPSTFYNSIGFEGIGRHLIVDCFGENALPRLPTSSVCTPTETRGISSSAGINIRHPSSVPYSGIKTWPPNVVDIVNDPSLNTPTEDENWKPLRVGVTDAKVDKATRTFATNGQNRLNKCAPIFVPGPDWQAKDLYLQYARDGAHSDTRLPYRREYFQPSYNDTMSPSTSSPSWSPMFSHFVDIHTLTTPRHSQDNPMFTDPKIYSPAFDDEDYSTRLMTMVQQFKGQEQSKVAKRYPTRTTNPSGGLQGDWKGADNTSNTERNLVVDGNQSAYINPDSRPNLSQQHPRSIPLARLIQRRLSSVVEEVGAETLVSQLEANLTERSFSHESLDETGLHRESVPSSAMMNFPVHDGMQPPQTVENRQHHGEPNAIVRLPRKTALHRSGQPPSRTADSKRTNRYEGRAERKITTTLGGNGVSAATTTKDGKLMAKIIEGIKEESV